VIWRGKVVAAALLFIFRVTLSGVGAREPCTTCVCRGPADRFVVPNVTLKLGWLKGVLRATRQTQVL